LSDAESTLAYERRPSVRFSLSLVVTSALALGLFQAFGAEERQNCHRWRREIVIVKGQYCKENSVAQIGRT
jgi:hypothetical protein